MERRRLLQLFGVGLGGVMLDEAIPFNRVWSFPKEIVIARPATIRFTREWNVHRNLMMSRLDVLYGWTEPLEIQSGLALCEHVTVNSESLIEPAIQEMVTKFSIPNLPSLRNLQRTSKDDMEIRGFWYEGPPTHSIQSGS